MTKEKILIICDATGGGIFEYAKPIYLKIKDKLNVKFLSKKREGFLYRVLFYKDIIKEILIGNYTTIDIHQLMWPMHVIVIGLKQIKRFELVFEAHEEPWTIHTRYRPMFIRKLIFSTSDKLVTHSRRNKKILEEMGYKVTAYAPMSTNLDNLKRYDTKLARKKLDWKNEHYVLFFGFITYNKGLDILLNAIPLITKEIKNIKFVISGKTFDEWKPYQKIIDSLNLKEHIIRIDKFLPWEEVNYIFSASDLVTMPYREANNSSIPGVVFFFKKPIIATNEGAFREMIIHNKTGLLFEKNNEKELAEAIIKLLRDKKLRDHLGENGYKSLQTTFSWKFITDQYLNKVFV